MTSDVEQAVKKHVAMILKEQRLAAQRKHGERVEARQKERLKDDVDAGPPFGEYRGPY